jgi:DNA-binding NarL/FixJ family response regulator
MSSIVLVADEQMLIRDGIKMLVTEILPDVHFLEANDGDSLLRAASSRSTIHLALIDLRMPGMHGGSRLTELASLHPRVPLVIVSAFLSADVARRVMRIPSVCACVPKTAHRDHVRSAVEAAIQGRKLSYAQLGPDSSHSEAALTPRQVEIRELLRQGLSNKMIARALGISEGTVKNHITEILRVLNATNRTQAARFSPEAE